MRHVIHAHQLTENELQPYENTHAILIFSFERGNLQSPLILHCDK